MRLLARRNENTPEASTFDLFKLEETSSHPQHKLAFDWADGPEDEPVPLTSVELQHKAIQWRIEDELDLK